MNREKDLALTIGVLETLAATTVAQVSKFTLSNLLADLSAEYIRLGLQMPDEEAWTWGKLIDSTDSVRHVGVFARKYNLTDRLRLILRVVAFAADIGRLKVRIDHGKDAREEQGRHGAYSAQILLELAKIPQHNTAAVDRLLMVMADAIRHHSDTVTPKASELYGGMNAPSAHHLCMILRDLDKVGVWLGKGRLYFESPSEMRRQLDQNRLSPDGYATLSVLEAFEAGEAIVRSTCKTYVDWALQFLLWKNDINFPEFWLMIQEDGAPKVALAYIRDALVRGGNEGVWRRVAEVALKQNIAVLD